MSQHLAPVSKTDEQNAIPSSQWFWFIQSFIYHLFHLFNQSVGLNNFKILLQFICNYLHVESEPNNWKTITIYHTPRWEMRSGTIAYPLCTYNLNKCGKCICLIIWDIISFCPCLQFLSIWNVVVSQYKACFCVVTSVLYFLPSNWDFSVLTWHWGLSITQCETVQGKT